MEPASIAAHGRRASLPLDQQNYKLTLFVVVVVVEYNRNAQKKGVDALNVVSMTTVVVV